MQSVDGLVAQIQDKLATPMQPEFWQELYHNGRVDTSAEANVLVAALMRLAVIALLILGARVLVALCARGVRRAVAAASARAAAESRRLTTLQGVIISVIAYAVYFVTGILMLFTTGVTWQALAPLLGAASVLGLAIGFGAQKLVKDVITGLFILGEGQFDVGDHVVINGVTATVEDMGLRVTRLRDDQGRLVIIANGDIGQVFNASRGLVKLTFEVAISRTVRLEESLSAIREAVTATMAERESGISDATIDLRVTGMEQGKVIVRVSLRVATDEKGRVEDEVRRRLLTTLESRQVPLA